MAAGNAPADAVAPPLEPSVLPPAPVDPIEPAAARSSSVAAPTDTSPAVPPQAPVASEAAATAALTTSAIPPAAPPQPISPASTPWKPPPAAPEAGATSGPLWGAPPPAETRHATVAAPAAAPLAGVATSPSRTARGAWTFGRAFARAALGMIIGFGVGVLYEIADDPSTSSEDLRLSVLLALLAIAAVFGGIVAVIENFVPALRIPSGSLYGRRRAQPLDRFRGIGPDPGHPARQRRRVLDLRGPDGRRLPRRRGPRRQTLRDPPTNHLRPRPGRRDLRAASRGPARGPGGPRRR